MPRLSKPGGPSLAANNTVKLSASLQRRIVVAMAVEGFTVWSEFCRVALTEKCHLTEDHLRARDVGEFQRVYPALKAPVAVARENKERSR